jgi:hypothetical protein
MPYALIQTHSADAQARLLQQFRNAPNLNALIGAIAGCVQEIENAVWQASTERSLFGGTAFGAQLDAIGALLGIARNGANDATYLLLLRGTALVNTSDATVPTILGIIQTLYGTASVWLGTPNSFGTNKQRAYGEISYAVGSPTTDASLFPLAQSLVQKALAAGVTINEVTTFDASGAFAFGPSTQSWVKGFGLGKLGGVAYSNTNR